MDTQGVLSCCDGCGRLGRTRIGWTQRGAGSGFPGLYCRSCTSALRTIELLLRCSGCGRHADERTAERTGWGYLWDGRDLVPTCAACLAARVLDRTAHGIRRTDDFAAPANRGNLSPVRTPDTDRFTRLRCEECRVWSDECARGWRALIIYHERNGMKTEDPERVLTYCPECAHREFDPDGYP